MPFPTHLYHRRRNRNRRPASRLLLAIAASCALAPVFVSQPPAIAATVHWTGAAGDGDWYNPANWQGGVLPSASDDVVNDTDQTVRLAFTYPSPQINSFITNGVLNLGNSGVLSIASSLTFTGNGELHMRNGATLIGASIADTSRLRFFGGTTASSRLLNVTLGGGLTLGEDVHVNLDGTTSFAAGSVFQMERHSQLGIESGLFDNATINIQGGSLESSKLDYSKPHSLVLGPNLVLNGYGQVGTDGYSNYSSIVNHTNIRATGGNGWGFRYDDRFTNNSTMVASGAGSYLYLYRTGDLDGYGTQQNPSFVNNGLIRAEDGGKITLHSFYTHTTPSGDLGALEVDGVGSEARLHLRLKTADLNGVTLSNGGALRLESGCFLDNTDATLDTASLVGATGERGSFWLASATIQGGTIANTQLLRFVDSATTRFDGVHLDGSELNLLSPSAPEISSSLAASAAFLGNTTHSSGMVIRIGERSELQFGDLHSSTPHLEHYLLDDATVEFVRYAGTSYYQPGSIGFFAGQGGTLTLGANLTLHGHSATIGTQLTDIFGPTNEVLINNTALRATQADSVWRLGTSGKQESRIVNNGLIEAVYAEGAGNASTAQVVINYSFTSVPPDGEPLQNNGTVRASQNGVITIGGHVAVTNQGTLEAVNGGVVNLDNFSLPGGAVRGTLTNQGSGTVHVGSESTLHLSAGGMHQKGTETLTLVNGELLAPNPDTTLLFAGGMVSGTGTILGSVMNSGATIAPGMLPDYGGELTFSGSFAQADGGTLLLQVGSSLDSLNVVGSAMLDGLLVVDPTLAGFDLNIGDTFQIVTATSLVGGFDQILSKDDAYAFRFDIQNGNSGVLTVIQIPSAAVPEPTSLLLLVAAAAMVCAPVALRSRTRQSTGIPH